MKAIENKLRESIGLDVAALGRPTLERTVRSQMKHLGITRPGDYARVLDSCPTQWNELVESVVVAETWFFRDPEVFTGLLRFAGAVWLPGARTEPLRLLSLPCASGEEPY
ncbi:MAG: CheR family methyltransferase, partial [Limisphaerales bacterium]